MTHARWSATGVLALAMGFVASATWLMSPQSPAEWNNLFAGALFGIAGNLLVVWFTVAARVADVSSKIEDLAEVAAPWTFKYLDTLINGPASGLRMNPAERVLFAQGLHTWSEMLRRGRVKDLVFTDKAGSRLSLSDVRSRSPEAGSVVAEATVTDSGRELYSTLAAIYRLPPQSAQRI
jgi:hypothetical protein